MSNEANAAKASSKAWRRWFERLGERATAEIVNATADLVTDERLAVLIARGILPAAASTVAPTVDRAIYSELIHVAAELARGDGFLSTCAEDLNPRLKRAGILKTAERQEERLKDWAYRVRQVANKLSAAASTVAPQQKSCGFCGKSDQEVKALIQAPVGYICEGCVAICASIIERNGVAPQQSATPPVCPDCQQGYVCEHCGKPICDYYAAPTPSAAVQDAEGEALTLDEVQE